MKVKGSFSKLICIQHAMCPPFLSLIRSYKPEMIGRVPAIRQYSPPQTPGVVLLGVVVVVVVVAVVVEAVVVVDLVVVDNVPGVEDVVSTFTSSI